MLKWFLNHDKGNKIPVQPKGQQTAEDGVRCKEEI